MADNVPITAGSGTSIATDDVGSVHYQRVKLVGGADGEVYHFPGPGGLSNARTTALASSLVVKASAGTLYGVQGYATAAGFVQVHDASSLPADASVPEEVIPVAADGAYSIDFGMYGVAFTTGIVVCFSSTGPTKTLGGSSLWISAQYK